MMSGVRASLTSLAVLLAAASCGNGGGDPRFDAPVVPPDMGDAALNARRLWLAPINGSETNLKLQETEPPPF
jgi:hypothetical protein